MRRFVTKAACAVFLSVSATVQAYAGAICWGPVYDPASNADLYVVSKESWGQAETEAMQLGGNLVTIHSAAENAFIVNNILQNFTGVGGPNLSAVPVWIGLYDPTGIANDDGPGGPGSQHAADFVWADGSAATYRDWNPDGEPNDHNGEEYYGTINWDFAESSLWPVGTWNDTPLAGTMGGGGNSDGPYYGLVAVPVPEPSTLVLLGIGAATLFAYGWRRRGRTLAVAVAFLSSLAAGSAYAQVRYAVTDLGTLPGCINSEALAINASGQVVGTCQAVGSSGNDQYAFLYGNGKMAGLGTLPGGADSWAYGINSSGQVVGNTYTLTPSYSYQAFLYCNGTATALGGFDSVAHAVNDNGQVAGWNNVNGTHAFLYGNGTMTDLGTLPGDSFSYGYGINASGSVVGASYTNTNSYHAFLYSNGKMTNLGTLPWCSTSEAYGINAGGQVVGDSDGHAFLYSNGAMIDLDPLHGTSYARGINDSGQAVGYFVSDSGDRAFLYSGGTSTDLNSLVASSWTLERAYAINDAGQIVGYGYNPQGQQDALLLTPVPEPSTFVLLGIGAAALLAYGWRRDMKVSYRFNP